MASTSSFDIVSEFDRQELVNALDQVRREVATRYDFKGSRVEITLGEKDVTVVTDSEMRSAAVQDLIGSKAVRRGLSLKVFDWGEVEPAGGLTFKQVAGLQRALPPGTASLARLNGEPWLRQVAANPNASIDRIWSAIGAALDG